MSDERYLPALIQYDKATRIEVIDSTGRVFVGYYSAGIEVHVQDGYQTIKIFAGQPASLVGETGPDTETTKLDPKPWRYDDEHRYAVEQMGSYTEFKPRPQYSQNRADYGITPEPSTEGER